MSAAGCPKCGGKMCHVAGINHGSAWLECVPCGVRKNIPKITRDSIEPDQRWQRAQAVWPTLGFHARVYYTQAHLQDMAKKEGKRLSGGEAFMLARQAVEEENARIMIEVNNG